MEPLQKPPKINLTPEMIRSFKTLTCDCGGMIFHTGVVIKKISPLISSTGEEEAYSLQVLICEKCGKVPNEINDMKLLPDEVLATKIITK
jgi:hypothetical protein